MAKAKKDNQDLDCCIMDSKYYDRRYERVVKKYFFNFSHILLSTIWHETLELDKFLQKVQKKTGYTGTRFSDMAFYSVAPTVVYPYNVENLFALQDAFIFDPIEGVTKKDFYKTPSLLGAVCDDVLPYVR